jgi:23S rRNA (pseudouridine1915-N3)-methyltransferase
MNIVTIFVKSDEELIKAAKLAKGTVFALDENGHEYSSIMFSKVLFEGLETGGSHATFLIGGFAGLPTTIKQAFPLISLSRMTWTHQFARLLLIEQIYRAVEIRKGSSYHKE